MTRSRLAYIDWMRGLACLLMFQTHGYNSWLAADLRQSRPYMISQLLGTFPAPLFLFLAGFSLALGVDRLETKGVAAPQIAKSFAKRGAEIFGIAMLFRIQQWAMSLGWAPWSDLLRVDILNTIGVSLALASLLPLIARKLWAKVAAACAIAAGFSLLTPIVWACHFDALPWWVASYLNGGHVQRIPRGWFFPLFPWTGFLFVGAAAGFIMMDLRRSQREGQAVAILAAIGAALVPLSQWLDRLFPSSNYWLTSPDFFLARCGLLLVILALCWAWCRLKPGKLWSPVEQLGSTSLLVYWVHIEFVYGRLSILPKQACSFAAASWGLVTIVLAMTLLSWLKTSQSYEQISRLWAKAHS